MDTHPPVPFNEPFGPDPAYRTLLWQYAALGCLAGVCTWLVPVLVFIPVLAVKAAVLALALAIVIPLIVWVPRYYRSISYVIGKEELTWRRGVWFRTTGIVPYRKITNIDIGQGPLSRRLGIGSLKVQTAGYSASKQGAEITINGIRGVEGARDLIMPFVRGAPATPAPQDTGAAMLRELVAIRTLLEERR